MSGFLTGRAGNCFTFIMSTIIIGTFGTEISFAFVGRKFIFTGSGVAFAALVSVNALIGTF